MKSRESKRMCLDECNNKEKNSLDKDEGKIESAKYIFSFFIPLFLTQKVSNHPSALGKRINSLNYLVYISKICFWRNANFALEFSDRKSSKNKKKLYTRHV